MKLPKSKLSKTLVKAYHVAHYKVTEMKDPFTLRIHEHSLEIEGLMKKHGVDTAVFITAYNPYSKLTDRNLNVRAHKALMGELLRMGLPTYEGFGEDPSGVWKSEPAFLILGIKKEAAEDLGDKFKQNAVVWIDYLAIPELIFLQ